MMTTTTTLAQDVQKVLTARMSCDKKAQALVKIGVTPYEAMILAKASMPPRATRTRTTFTYTFGVEIECVGCRPASFITAATNKGLSVIDHTGRYCGCHTDVPQFKLVPDSSISGYAAAECVTPALSSTNKGFGSLEACCLSLAEVGATANRSCGLHVHIGARDLTDSEYCNVFVNYMRLETAIESFLAPSRRGAYARWCASLRNREAQVLAATTKYEMRGALNYDRYHRVNAEAYDRHQTIEFRQHQGSTNYTKISHWVKFLGKLVEWSRTNRLTENIDRIEDIPFLGTAEKAYFCRRRAEFEAR